VDRAAAHIQPRGVMRLAELIAALSLATDLGMGQPMSHALRTCLIALALGRALGFSERDLADTYYTTLLRFVGCTSDSHEFLDFAAGDDVGFRQAVAANANGVPDQAAADIVRFMTAAGVGGDVPARVSEALASRTGVAAKSMTAHCEVASMLAARLGLGPGVCDALGHAFERWDGHGFPDGKSGEEVPAPMHVAPIARDIEVLTRSKGLEATREAMRQRRGHAHDPRAVDVFLQHGDRMMAELEGCDAWTEVLRREPCGPVKVDRIDTALTAFADFADVKMPHTLGHSRGVAQFCEAAARRLNFGEEEVTSLRRAALLHDIGRSGISNAIWEREGPLSMDQWERVRLHAYYTERVLACCDSLRPLAALAGSHHERLDGSGYHRGCRGNDLDRAARVLAAADACQAMLQARPHRPARTLDEAARILREEVSAGKLDTAAVEAVLAAAGAPAQRRRTSPKGPKGLTVREVEVLRLMARGHSNQEMAAALGITLKTAGHHVQHIYDKIGLSTRAAAAVFAVEHGLLGSWSTRRD
jgi:HD-GYP domain-containing protein (c-di-GMP phosphodiesterase class II)